MNRMDFCRLCLEGMRDGELNKLTDLHVGCNIQEDEDSKFIIDESIAPDIQTPPEKESSYRCKFLQK